MRRLASLVLAAAALAAPAAAAQPPPADPSTPTFAGRPYLVREDATRLTLYLRVERELARRFDGELRATAEVGGRRSSLGAVDGVRPATACYAATVRTGGADTPRPGSRHTVALVLDGEPVVSVTARARVRAPREGDARGAPLGC
ncbi:MAG: hypothetical protein QOD55_2332 [Solirubrobacteraceae bacterium]|nr:hypothetical protein [Solirubrobacteraceae bacterium]